MTLQGKTAIITGGGRGIGAAVALRLAQAGARVMLFSRTETELRATVASICQTVSAADVAWHVGDVSDESAVAALFAATLTRFGRVDILVNAAAVIGVAQIATMDMALFDRIMAINLRGTVLCCRAAFQQMQAQGGGEIINFSSLGGIQGTQKFAGYSAYSASKAAIVVLTEALAVEGKPHHIRVNAIAPGAVDTLMLRQAAPSLRTSTMPADIAGTVLFLSDRAQSRALNGTIIEIHSNE